MAQVQGCFSRHKIKVPMQLHLVFKVIYQIFAILDGTNGFITKIMALSLKIKKS